MKTLCHLVEQRSHFYQRYSAIPTTLPFWCSSSRSSHSVQVSSCPVKSPTNDQNRLNRSPQHSCNSNRKRVFFPNFKMNSALSMIRPSISCKFKFVMTTMPCAQGIQFKAATYDGKEQGSREVIKQLLERKKQNANMQARIKPSVGNSLCASNVVLICASNRWDGVEIYQRDSCMNSYASSLVASVRATIVACQGQSKVSGFCTNKSQILIIVLLRIRLGSAA